MGARKCCIQNCDSKNGNEQTLFKIPKNNEQNWMNAISPHLSKGKYNRKHLYVCELHFNEADILRHYETKLPDGCICRAARGILGLNAGSVPSIFNVQQMANVVLPAVSSSFENNVEIAIEDTAEDEVLPMAYSLFDTNIKTDPEHTAEDEILPVPVASSAFGSNVEIAIEHTAEDEVLAVASSLFESNIKMEPEHTDEEEIMSAVSAGVSSNTQSVLNTTEGYNVNALFEDLQALQNSEQLPKHWGFMKVPIGIYFCYFGDIQNVFSRSMFVAQNMTVEVRANGALAMADTAKTITCVDDILSAMRKISRLAVCQGIDEITICPKGFFEATTSIQTFQSVQRCIECRIKRKAMLNKGSQKSRRANLKKAKTKSFKKFET